MADGKLIFDLLSGKDTLTRKILSAKKEATDFGGILKIAGGNFASALAIKGLGLIVSGFKSAIGEIKGFITAAQSQEDAVNALNISLAQAGIFSKETSKGFQDFASRLQETTKFSGDAVLQSAALIQQLGKLDSDGLKRATKSALDLSSALGIDLSTASTLVGKAAAGSIEAFQRYGIVLKTGKTSAETFSNTLNSLEKKFGGSSEAAVRTFSGGLLRLNNTMGDTGKLLGLITTNNAAVIGAVSGLNKVFLFFQNIIKNNAFAINDFITKGVDVLLSGINILIKAFEITIETLDVFARTFQISFKIISVAVEAFALISIGALLPVEKAINALTERFPLLAKVFGENVTVISDISETLKDSIIKDAKDLGKAFDQTGPLSDAASKVGDFSRLVTDIIQEQVNKQKELYGEDENAFLQALSDKNAADIDASNKRLSNAQLLQESLNVFNEEQRLLQLEASQLEADENFQFLADNLGQEEALKALQQSKDLEAQGKHNEAVKKLSEARAKAEQQTITGTLNWETATNKQRVAQVQSTLGLIAGLTASTNKTLFAIGKAAAISNATISGIEAVNKTYAFYPAPFGFPLAALVGAAAAANVAKIASQQLPSFAHGGIVPSVPGVPRTGDNVQANLNPGEVVLNEAQQDTLATKLSNGNDNILVQILSQPIVIQIDGREIARATRNQIQNGFKLA